MKTQDVKMFSETLATAMKDQLEAIERECQEELVRISRSKGVARNTLLTLKVFIHTYAFKDKSEEITFFKDIKPKFQSQYLYYQQLLSLRTREPIGSKEVLLQYYQQELQNIQSCIRENLEFHLYWLSGSTESDAQYFLRTSNPFEPHLDEKFTTGYDTLLASLMANDRVRDYLLTSIHNVNTSETTGLSWTGPKTALIELAYALQAVDALNGGKADLKQIASAFENLFHINLGNYYRTFQEIRLRKSGRTNFLDQLKNKFIQRMDEMD